MYQRVPPSTLYNEGNNPCIESPLAAAASLMEMLITSYGGLIRVFPAIPSNWTDIVFYQLRTEGAFLISAKYANSRTQWIQIQSEVIEDCSVLTNMKGPYSTIPSGVPIDVRNGILHFNVKKGSTLIIYTEGTSPDFTVTPLPGQPSFFNYWGYH
eukprot:TRINITY_DN3683_c0_g2_i1.p1 TRINITY_DN3683_c0_g2~~TRINITY_DN3683_c0_g2_i1.p1  ORF type:complete len:180 (-),score=18.31 TRINITY_DN3683_c0_g2_i1:9-473(-)